MPEVPGLALQRVRKNLRVEQPVLRAVQHFGEAVVVEVEGDTAPVRTDAKRKRRRRIGGCGGRRRCGAAAARDGGKREESARPRVSRERIA